MGESKTALITGIRGQDAAYLAKNLLEKGYRVIGGDRRSGGSTYWRLEELGIKDKIKIEYMDLTEPHVVDSIIKQYQFDEVYNLAAQSFVQTSFSHPYTTTNANFHGVMNLLEAIRVYSPDTKFYQASTSEMFGKVQESPQKETTPFYPRSPYGIAKLAAHWLTINYRESYNIFGACGILFNHESPLRGEEFVTRKITKTVARIQYGQEKILRIGNVNAIRDWGHAEDYVEAMYRILQQEKPSEYVIATGTCHTVKEFIDICFHIIGEPLTWDGEGVNTKAYSKEGRLRVEIDPQFFRPADVHELLGDPHKAKSILSWIPEYSFYGLIENMLEADLRRESWVKSS